MEYKKCVLKNGLRVVTVEVPGMESASVAVWVRVGSRFENPKVAGVSHFLEHMAFKGGKKYPTSKIVAEKIDSVGAANNAGTSKEWTNYWVKGRVGVMESSFDLLSDMLLFPKLRRKDIEQERGVILEEISMYEDMPMAKVDGVYENLVFSGSQLGVEVIGTRKTVKAIGQEDIRNCMKNSYLPSNMLITVAGGMKPSDVTRLAEKYFGGMEFEVTGLGYEKYDDKQMEPGFRLEKKKCEQAHLVIGFKAYERGSEKRFAAGLLATILGSGMSSRLFEEVREKRGLAYAVKTSYGSYMDTGDLSTYGGIRIEKAQEAVKVILDQYYGLRDKKYAITASELKKAKEYNKGHMALQLEGTEAINQYYARQELFLNEVLSPEQIYKKIDEVKMPEVYEVAKEIFRPEKLNLAIIGPFDEARVFERLLK